MRCITGRLSLHLRTLKASEGMLVRNFTDTQMSEIPEKHCARRPLRLVFVANRHQSNDGQGRVNYEVALAALNCGMKVTLLSAYCADEIANHPNAQFVRVGNERLPTQLLRNLAFANESASWLRQHRGEWDLVQ